MINIRNDGWFLSKQGHLLSHFHSKARQVISTHLSKGLLLVSQKLRLILLIHDKNVAHDLITECTSDVLTTF